MKAIFLLAILTLSVAEDSITLSLDDTVKALKY